MLSSFFFLLSQVIYLNTRSNDSNYLFYQYVKVNHVYQSIDLI
ncbi:unnamed protein product [Brassica rapa subsp. narinosa]